MKLWILSYQPPDGATWDLAARHRARGADVEVLSAWRRDEAPQQVVDGFVLTRLAADGALARMAQRGRAWAGAAVRWWSWLENDGPTRLRRRAIRLRERLPAPGISRTGPALPADPLRHVDFALRARALARAAGPPHAVCACDEGSRLAAALLVATTPAGRVAAVERPLV